MNLLLVLVSFFFGCFCSFLCYSIVLINKENDSINKEKEEPIVYKPNYYEFDDESLNE